MKLGLQVLMQSGRAPAEDYEENADTLVFLRPDEPTDHANELSELAASSKSTGGAW